MSWTECTQSSVTMSSPGESSSASSNTGKRKRTEDEPTLLDILKSGRNTDTMRDMKVSEFFEPVKDMKMSELLEMAQALQSENAPPAQDGERGDALIVETSSDETSSDKSSSDESSSDDEDAEPYYDRKAIVTELKVRPPEDFKPECGCKAGKDEQGPCVNCSCSKWGERCSPETCGCGDACENPFNALNTEEIFGDSPKVELCYCWCFIAWILKRGYEKYKLKPHQITLKWLFDKIHVCAEQEDLRERNKAYNAWKEDWEKVAEETDDNPKKVQAMRDLLNIAFDEDFGYGGSKPYGEENGYYLSFCSTAVDEDRIGWWFSEDTSLHCLGCGDCMGWLDWHCRDCNKCVEGVEQRCDGCKGVSDNYHELLRP
ncbi:hypothetical protein IWZ01DRAFT_3591 [Phyllosticta capitalensis]